ncbi:hypothetical protein LZ30DRAFT_735090 [Colletotrichum cereale]|nr:hypothetical protein LZ30DRAFT_735090 [Colletotrichum cereale]
MVSNEPTRRPSISARKTPAERVPLRGLARPSLPLSPLVGPEATKPATMPSRPSGYTWGGGYSWRKRRV